MKGKVPFRIRPTDPLFSRFLSGDIGSTPNNLSAAYLFLIPATQKQTSHVIQRNNNTEPMVMGFYTFVSNILSWVGWILQKLATHVIKPPAMRSFWRVCASCCCSWCGIVLFYDWKKGATLFQFKVSHAILWSIIHTGKYSPFFNVQHPYSVAVGLCLW